MIWNRNWSSTQLHMINTIFATDNILGVICLHIKLSNIPPRCSMFPTKMFNFPRHIKHFPRTMSAQIWVAMMATPIKGTVGHRCCGRPVRVPPMLSSPWYRFKLVIPPIFFFKAWECKAKGVEDRSPQSLRCFCSGRSRHGSNGQGRPHGAALRCKQRPHWVHSDTGQHPTDLHMLTSCWSCCCCWSCCHWSPHADLLLKVMLWCFEGDALRCWSERLGREWLLPHLLLRCSRIRWRHQVVPVNIQDIHSNSILRMLISLGASTNIKDRKGRTAGTRSLVKKSQKKTTTVFSFIQAFAFIFLAIYSSSSLRGREGPTGNCSGGQSSNSKHIVHIMIQNMKTDVTL